MPIIATINVNGIRAATKLRDNGEQGLLTWLANTKADYVCLQELRATAHQTKIALHSALASGWKLCLAEAAVKGRNGVAILSRSAPDKVHIGFGTKDFDNTGRFVAADFGDLTVASLYLPSGEVGTERQNEKMYFCELFLPFLNQFQFHNEKVVIGGDWNIAHTENDLKNWQGNKNNSGFLPEERAWLTKVFDTGWVDVVRKLYPDQVGPYSWWSYRGKAFDNDAGWRIDYQIATSDLAHTAKSAVVEKATSYLDRWSDHAPVVVNYEYEN